MTRGAKKPAGFAVGWLAAALALVPMHLGADDLGLPPGFDVEGPDPVVSGPEGPELVFSALASRVLTSNGHGLRHEVKRRAQDRRPMADTSETLSATVGFALSPGAKTIVVQYHEGDTQTLFKLYIGDLADRRLTNGVASDGVFDVYARIDDPQGNEVVYPFLALRSGGRFSFALHADRGVITLTVDGKTVVQKTKDADGVFLKWGDYLQAQDPVTGRQEAHEGIPTFYERHGITVDTVTFGKVVYNRVR